MPLFRYRAVDPYGEPMEGSMDEVSAHRVTQILLERGAQVNSVEQIPDGARKPFGLGPRRLRWDDVATINSQLLAIARAGIPMASSVNAMAKDIENRRLRPVLESLQRDLDAGRSLEEAISRSPAAFPPMYLSLIRAAERSGNLPGVLTMISDYSTRILDLRDRIFAAALYPLYVAVTGIIILASIMIDVVPQFEEVFNDFGGSLPAPTQFLVNLSHFLRDHGAYVLLALAVLFAAYVLARARVRRGDPLYAKMDWLRERIPVLGRSFRTITIARFSKSLGLLLEGRVPIEESLDLASAASGNEYLRDRVRLATRQIAQGEKVAEAFLDTRYFPHSYLWFLANGESREKLPKTLIELSESYERDVSARDRALLNLIAPVSVLVLGMFVAFMVIAMYLPMFTLGDAISGG